MKQSKFDDLKLMSNFNSLKFYLTGWKQLIIFKVTILRETDLRDH
jgi:hypothetical protein